MKKLTTIIGILMLLLISCETATETQKEYEHHCLGPISYFQDGVYWWHLETWMAYNTMDWNDNIEYGVLQEAWHLDTLWQVRTVGFIESDTVITGFNEADDNELTEVIPSEIDKVLGDLRKRISEEDNTPQSPLQRGDVRHRCSPPSKKRGLGGVLRYMFHK